MIPGAALPQGLGRVGGYDYDYEILWMTMIIYDRLNRNVKPIRFGHLTLTVSVDSFVP